MKAPHYPKRRHITRVYLKLLRARNPNMSRGESGEIVTRVIQRVAKQHVEQKEQTK